MTTNTVLEVDRTRCRETRLVESELEPLGPAQLRLQIDRFSVTANNIAYAVLGDILGYWDFFPTGDPDWGRVPAMGWADVVESTHPDIATGGRYYGWFPMARFVDLTVRATDDGFRDDGDHRVAHAPVYRNYVGTTHDPMYPSGASGDELGDAEDRHALLRGLFITSYLADSFFADAAHHGADVVTYDDVASLPRIDAVSVDVSGDGPVLAAVHERLGDHLKFSMIIGRSHHDSPLAQVEAGPTPELFFAPTEVGRRLEEWGADEYQRRCTEALEEFVAGSRRWLTVHRARGPAAAASTWSEVFDGQVPPSIGRIASLHH